MVDVDILLVEGWFIPDVVKNQILNKKILFFLYIYHKSSYIGREEVGME